MAGSLRQNSGALNSAKANAPQAKFVIAVEIGTLQSATTARVRAAVSR